MTSRDFCFWLQGYFELAEVAEISGPEMTKDQVKMVRRPLNLVFKHEIDPSMGDEVTQKELNELHFLKPPMSGGGGAGSSEATIFRC